jgi:hypothetical protein
MGSASAGFGERVSKPTVGSTKREQYGQNRRTSSLFRGKRVIKRGGVPPPLGRLLVVDRPLAVFSDDDGRAALCPDTL